METNKNNTLTIHTINDLAQLDHIGFAKQIVDNIKEGVLNPLQIHLFLKRFEELKKEVDKDKVVKELITSEAAKHIQEGKTFEYLGAKLTVAAVSTKYDFTACNDPLWDNLNELSAKIKEMKDAREDFLKVAFKNNDKFGFTAPTVVIDKLYFLDEADCGEEARLNAPIKKQVTGLRTSFK